MQNIASTSNCQTSKNLSSKANLQLYYVTRSNRASFSRGVLSEESYNRREKRRMVSLKICVMACLIELIGVISSFISAVLGIHKYHYTAAITMFLVIPFLHLMNDEETKTIITEKNWYQGLRSMLGIYNQIAPEIQGRIPQYHNNLNQIAVHFPSRLNETNNVIRLVEYYLFRTITIVSQIFQVIRLTRRRNLLSIK